MIRSRPLRFLAAVLGGWAAIRAAMLGPAWWSAPAATNASEPPIRLASGLPKRLKSTAQPAFAAAAPPRVRPIPTASPRLPASAAVRTRIAALGEAADPAPPPATPAAVFASPPPPPPPPPIATLRRAARAERSSAYGWAFVRPGRGPALAPGGTLGGSQAGLRATYRLNRDSARPLALAARLASPLADRGAAEAALGIEWRPSRSLPVHLLAERRQKLGPDGRSAFALMLHGGISEAPLGPVRIDAYAQAGVVGARTRDPFVDGAMRMSLPLGDRARAGAGAWAAAQPGAARLDLGPQASLRLPLGGGSVTVAADWRLRVAGEARPGSGPTLTLSTSF